MGINRSRRLAVALSVSGILIILGIMGPIAGTGARSGGLWFGSYARLDPGSAWTKSAFSHLVYSGEYFLEDPSEAPRGMVGYYLSGDVLADSGIQEPDVMGSRRLPNTWSFVCFGYGETDVPLTAGDGLKNIGLHFEEWDVSPHAVSPEYTNTVTLDTHGPQTLAPYRLSCGQRGYVTFSYQVDDALSPTADVSLHLRSSTGKKLKAVPLGEQETGKLLAYLWKCTLPKGKYKYSILATDLAGNNAAKIGTSILTVR